MPTGQRPCQFCHDLCSIVCSACRRCGTILYFCIICKPLTICLQPLLRHLLKRDCRHQGLQGLLHPAG
jgi:hypothetical protein